MKNNKKDIIESFRKKPHSIQFIKKYEEILNDFRAELYITKKGSARNSILADEWEFKRWFWSFVENAVIYHTHTITFDKEETLSYDVKLVLKSLLGLGVKIKKE